MCLLIVITDLTGLRNAWQASVPGRCFHARPACGPGPPRVGGLTGKAAAGRSAREGGGERSAGAGASSGTAVAFGPQAPGSSPFQGE